MFNIEVKHTEPYELYLGDCLEIMPTLPDKSIDMILCDLPYGTTACKWDVVLSFEKLWEQYERLIRPNGAMVFTASHPFTAALIMSKPKWFRHSWVWDKRFAGNFALAKYQPLKRHEDVVVFGIEPVTFYPIKTPREEPIKLGGNKCKSESSAIAHAKPEYENKVYTDKNPESIIYISNRSESRGLHPTQKPVALMEYLIKSYTQEDETVLDNCMGSGTTGVACVNTRRRFIGIEKEEKYYWLAQERIAEVYRRNRPEGLLG